MKQISGTDTKEMIEFQISHNESRIKKTKSKSRSKARNKHIDAIKKHAPSAVSILCIGCRSKSELDNFSTSGFDPVGIDLIPCEHYVVMDAHEIGDHFEENQFDFVYASHSFEHFYDPDRVMRGIKKVSRGGVMVVLPSWSKDTYNYNKKAAPSLSHPAIYDLMFKNRRKLSEVKEKDLNDFHELRPFELIHYKKVSKNKKLGTIDECELLFSWGETK